MKLLFTILAFVCVQQTINAQDKFFTRNGRINFFSKATIEDIEAVNKTVTCVLDIKTGNLQFSVQVKAFEFEKLLMQEHFNENYMQSDSFPKAIFKGLVVNNQNVFYSKDGSYEVMVKGDLTMHGKTKTVEAPGIITIQKGKIIATSTFNILLQDFKIKNDRPGNISNNIKITVQCTLEPLKS